MEFSRFDFTGRRDRRLHLSRSGVSPRLARNQGLPRSMGARSSGLCGFRRGAGVCRPLVTRASGLPRSRLRCLPGLKPPVWRQFLDLLRHLGGQGHGGLGGQCRDGMAPAGMDRPGLDPGNSSGDLGHIVGRWHDVGFAQVGPGHVDIGQPLGGGNRWPWNRAGGVICLRPRSGGQHRLRRHHVVDPGNCWSY